ncbi:MAG: DNA polymerase III subunit delta, partial [Bacteroidota bacterium]|nr:DNA polymerase III subunit delta [Bacteroidota bacterium]
NYLRALSLLNPDEQTLYYLEKFKEVMRLSYSRKVPDLFIWANEISAIGREKQKAFLLYCLKQIRENFIANARTPEISYMSSEESEFSARFSPFINEKNVISISQEFEKSYLHVSMNGNPKIIFLDMALKITKLIR